MTDDVDDEFEDELEEEVQVPAPVLPERDEGRTAFIGFLEQRLGNMHNAAIEINKMTAARIRRVPEPHFRTQLLPVVRSWVTKSEQALDIRYWLNVADGLNYPIHVVDADDNILFTVPPPFIDIPITTQYNPGERFSTVYQEVALQGIIADSGNPKEFWKMEREIGEKYQPRPEQEDMARAMSQLVGMYQYYDLPLEEILGEEGAKHIAPVLADGSGQTPAQKDETYDDNESWNY